jgi:hypothetical protein
MNASAGMAAGDCGVAFRCGTLSSEKRRSFPREKDRGQQSCCKLVSLHLKQTIGTRQEVQEEAYEDAFCRERTTS